LTCFPAFYRPPLLADSPRAQFFNRPPLVLKIIFANHLKNVTFLRQLSTISLKTFVRNYLQVNFNSVRQIMKNIFFEISSLFCMAAVLSPFLNPDCLANTAGKPVVIRKKITASTEKTPNNVGRSSTVLNQKSRIPEPKSDISISRNNSAGKKIAGVDTTTSRRLRPLYNPAGKKDPFEPLIKETPKIQTASEMYADTDPKGTTALEKNERSNRTIVFQGNGIKTEQTERLSRVKSQ
jgi:hypothetical protein